MVCDDLIFNSHHFSYSLFSATSTVRGYPNNNHMLVTFLSYVLFEVQQLYYHKKNNQESKNKLFFFKKLPPKEAVRRNTKEIIYL